MHTPVRDIHSNILVGHDDSRAALFRVQTVSYPHRSTEEQEEWWSRLATYAYIVGADFSVYRVTRDISNYSAQARELLDDRFGTEGLYNAVLDGHEQHLADRPRFREEVYVMVALAGVGARGLRTGIRRDFDRARQRLERYAHVEKARTISSKEIETLAHAEADALQTIQSCLSATRASTREIQWLFARAPYLGLCEPPIDEHWEPNAVVVKDTNGKVTYEPHRHTSEQLVDAWPEERDGRAVLRTEAGTSYQALMTVGAMPKTVRLGVNAELFFRPFEELEFPVDVVMHVQWEGNQHAVSRVARKVLDADNERRDEDESAFGSLSWAADKRGERARVLREYIEGEDQPPLLRVASSVRVYSGMPTPPSDMDKKEVALLTHEAIVECDRRMKAVRHKFGTVKLKRPVAAQKNLWYDHLPRTDCGTVRAHQDFMTVMQVAAFMPIATHDAGPARGVHAGRIITGGQRSLLVDLRQAAEEHQPPSWLITGVQGSGKTIFAETLGILDAITGGIVIDIDSPKGDHGLHRVPTLQGLMPNGHPRVRRYSLTNAPRGTLDPLVVAPPDMRLDLSGSVWSNVLPAGGDTEWSTEIRRSTQAVINDPDIVTCGDSVIKHLKESISPKAKSAGDALEVWGASGLSSLLFSDGTRGLEDEAQVTSWWPSGLSLPAPGSPIGEHERSSVAIIKALTARAMKTISFDRTVHKTVILDEAWYFLGTPDGRAWLAELNRMARYWNCTLILLSQLVNEHDLGDIDDLIGQRVAFGVKTDNQAKAALVMMGMPVTRRRVGEFRKMRKGLGFIRDLDDNVAQFQSEPVFAEWLEALDTSPQAQARQREHERQGLA